MTYMIAQTTIYRQSIGDPEPYLRSIAEAGFTHVHWSHQWYTDFLYSAAEAAQIARWVKTYNLQVLDIHASAGQEKRWDSTEEYQRLAGIELVRNRLELAAFLGARAIVLHAYSNMPFEVQRRSLSELEPHARLLGVRIALENLFEGNELNVARMFGEFSPDYLGYCYDTGHGNMVQDGMDLMVSWKERLAVLHIHDNDGVNDLHKLPFTSTVDWERFIDILDRSAYEGPINLECTMSNHGDMEDQGFLQAAYQAGTKLETMRKRAGDRTK